MTTPTERHTPLWERGVRRAVDVVIAGSALLVLTPLMAVIAVAIRLTSAGPALFTQRRVGLPDKSVRAL